MCYVSTTYYLLCGCYGKLSVTGERCIRGTSQLGLSTGCWDRENRGVDSVHALCPKCQKKEKPKGSESERVAGRARESQKASSHKTIQHGGLESERGAKKISPAGSWQSPATRARLMLSWLPPSVSKNRSPSKGDVWKSGRPRLYDESFGDALRYQERQQTAGNLHWRAYDGRSSDGPAER